MSTHGVPKIRLLAPDPQSKGDLFARLVADVFLSLGYETPRMNIQKTGREIDLHARHRLEDKICVAECKAQKRPVGGDDLNKFAGVLERERHRASATATQGYFISLSGFRESAKEQEQEVDVARFVLLDGAGIEEQLVAGGMIVSREKACEVAGGLASANGLLSAVCGRPQLIAHPLGWLWLCTYEQDHKLTHFALVHADGRAIAPTIAQEVVTWDESFAAELKDLEYVGPEDNAKADADVAEADRLYKSYLRSELGEITLEGLPADEEVGARHIALEDLYVPLRVERAIRERQKAEDARDTAEGAATDIDEDGVEDEEAAEDRQKEMLGSTLAREGRLAILAAPGAGKSTLIKRLAVAYAHPQNRALIADDLPDEDWLPIFIRCRTLGQTARDPIWRILDEIPSRGEFPDGAEGFHDLVARALVQGKALLLIDGLDEISDPGERIAFVRQLRTFLGTYPSVHLVLTSRERGFRAVAGAMGSVCEWYKLSEFEDDDIRYLTRAWHETVVGRSAKVVKDAEALASTIIETDRVRRLARNPLLLTTLLLVKRWVGALPRKRTMLYEKAIEVLLMTWNVEAHEPIDRDEAIPQLAFVAYAMTARGVQSLGASTLTKLLSAARDQMPEILGFPQMSVSQFVEQIENRSSLLVMTGHVEEAGALVPNYEFRHLTFQEYLTAVALVEGFYENHTSADSLTEQLAPHFNDPAWLEVITLANVRAGRGASEVVSELLRRLNRVQDSNSRSELQSEAEILARGLADEVQLPPQLVMTSAHVLGRFRIPSIRNGLFAEIMQGRYGRMFREVIEDAYLEDKDPAFAEYGGALASLLEIDEDFPTLQDEGKVLEVNNMLTSSDSITVGKGALLAMEMAFRSRIPSIDEPNVQAAVHHWPKKMIELARDGRPFVAYAAAWALVWLCEVGVTKPEDAGEGLTVMVDLWRRTDSWLVEKQAAWACVSLPEVQRQEEPFRSYQSADLCRFVEAQAKLGEEEDTWREDRLPAALLLGYYLRKPWGDEELTEKAKAIPSEAQKGPVLARLAS